MIIDKIHINKRSLESLEEGCILKLNSKKGKTFFVRLKKNKRF